MPCFKPLNAWQTRPGLPVCFTPQHRDARKLQLACGQCTGCRLERSRQWATRCIHEASEHTQNCFITLTYDDENVPWPGTLVKKHFQDFMKRLRRRYEPQKIRYFMCGEYGEQLMRPHYHALLFGFDFQDRQLWTTREGINVDTSAQLESLWPKGFSTVGEVTWQTAAYTSRYCLKKITGKDADEHYLKCDLSTGELISITPEYNAMSLRPAIGRTWFEKYRSDCYPKDFITHEGKKFRVPRYYDKLLEADDPTRLDQLKLQRRQKAWQWESEQTKERLRSREQCALARTKRLIRPIERTRPC